MPEGALKCNSLQERTIWKLFIRRHYLNAYFKFYYHNSSNNRSNNNNNIVMSNNNIFISNYNGICTIRSGNVSGSNSISSNSSDSSDSSRSVVASGLEQHF